MKRTMFAITACGCSNVLPFRVRGKDAEHAAQIGVRRLYGRKRGLRAQRVTGVQGRTGYFQAYLPLETGGYARHGHHVHVREA